TPISFNTQQEIDKTLVRIREEIRREIPKIPTPYAQNAYEAHDVDPPPLRIVQELEIEEVSIRKEIAQATPLVGHVVADVFDLTYAFRIGFVLSPQIAAGLHIASAIGDL